jgi:hypothetical protein
MLYVIGTLKGSVDTEPVGMLPLGNFNRAEGASRTLRVVNSNPAETLRVANVRLLDVRDPKALRGEAGAKPCDSAVASHVKVHYEETIPGKQGQVVVQVKETMPAGPFSFRVAFDTGIAGGPAVFSIPVTGLAK